MDASSSSDGSESMMSLHCEEEFPWDMMYPWLASVRKLVENNGMWVWSVDTELSVRVKSMLSAEEKPMIQVATIPCHEWVLVADCEESRAILLIRGKPSFFIYPCDPRCDWNLVHRILNTYYVGVTSLIQHRQRRHQQAEEEEEEEDYETKTEHVGYHRSGAIPAFDHQEGARDQASFGMVGRGHHVAFTPVVANPFDRMPSIDHEQVYHFHPASSASLDFNNGSSGIGFLNDTHSPRLSLSGTWDGVPRGNA